MTDNDLVDLVYVTTHNFLPVNGIKRGEANRQIQSWWSAREAVMNGTEDAEKARLHLAKGTIAINIQGAATEPFYAQWAVGVEHIIGMYIRERQDTAQDILARAQKKIADAIEKQANAGDEWKGGEE